MSRGLENLATGIAPVVILSLFEVPHPELLRIVLPFLLWRRQLLEDVHSRCDVEVFLREVISESRIMRLVIGIIPELLHAPEIQCIALEVSQLIQNLMH